MTNPDSHSNPTAREGTQSYPRLTQMAWLPVPLLALVIAGLWIADLRTVYESQALMVLLNVFFNELHSFASAEQESAEASAHASSVSGWQR